MKKVLFILGLILSVAFLYAQNPTTEVVKKSTLLSHSAVIDAPDPLPSREAGCIAAKGLLVEYDAQCGHATLSWYAPTELLWDNTFTSNSGYPSIRFLMAALSRDIIGDDFEIPAGEQWLITELYYGGFYRTSGGDFQPPDYLGIGLYDDAGNGLPGSLIVEYGELTTLSKSFASTWQTALLPEPQILGAGKYWVSIYGSYMGVSNDEAGYYIVCNEQTILEPFAAWDEISGEDWNFVNANLPSISFRVFGRKSTIPPLYNIYRNDQLIAENVSELTYVDYDANLDGANKWSVKVACEDGESSPVNANKQKCVPVGIAENEQFFTIAPNPASNTVKIASESIFNKVDVVNFMGQVVISTTQDGTQATIDVSNLSNGIYFVRITTDNGVAVQKFIKN